MASEALGRLAERVRVTDLPKPTCSTCSACSAGSKPAATLDFFALESGTRGAGLTCSACSEAASIGPGGTRGTRREHVACSAPGGKNQAVNQSDTFPGTRGTRGTRQPEQVGTD